MAEKDKTEKQPEPPKVGEHGAALGFARSDEAQAKVSEDLKKADVANRKDIDMKGVRTISVRARSGRPGGQYRAGQRIPGPPAPGAKMEWAEFETTEEGFKLLQADPSIVLEGHAASSDAKWPPEGMTPEAHAKMRLAAAADIPSDAIDSTGKNMVTGEKAPMGAVAPQPGQEARRR